MDHILQLIDSALAESFADEDISDLVHAIQSENVERMARRARTLSALSGKPTVLLDGEIAWELGQSSADNRRYAVMTHSGMVQEVTFPSSTPKPRRL